MQNLNYSEAALATSDTKLAAILLGFGFRLMRAPHPVCQWAYEFASKRDFLRWFSARNNGQNPPRDVQVYETATWNIAATEGKSLERAQSISSAYESGRNNWQELEQELGYIDPARKQRVLRLVEACVVEMCRKTLDQRELLVRLLKTRPKNALWIVVRDPTDRKRFSMFGANASAKTIEEHLNLL